MILTDSMLDAAFPSEKQKHGKCLMTQIFLQSDYLTDKTSTAP